MFIMFKSRNKIEGGYFFLEGDFRFLFQVCFFIFYGVRYLRELVYVYW